MVRTIQVGSDQVIIGKNGSALVSSKSDPGAWHSVRTGVCTCRGYQFRGRCRHLGAVAAATGQGTPVVNATFDLYAQTLSGSFA